MNKDIKEQAPLIVPLAAKSTRTEDIKLPECCKEDEPTCSHVAQKQRKVKVNIGL